MSFVSPGLSFRAGAQAIAVVLTVAPSCDDTPGTPPASESGVADVSSAGVVRGLAPGRSTITVVQAKRPSVRTSALVEVHPP
jgi:hypothetical protein